MPQNALMQPVAADPGTTQNPLLRPDLDPGNPLLRGAPSWADAWQFNMPVVQQHLADAWATAQDPAFWTDAARQWAGAMVAGTGGGPAKYTRETINIVPGVDMRINPSVPMLQRMVQKHDGLRAISDGTNIAVAPSSDTIHDEMLSKLEDVAHPLAAGKEAWVISPDGRVIDSNAGAASLEDWGVDRSRWPRSLQLTFPPAE